MPYKQVPPNTVELSETWERTLYDDYGAILIQIKITEGYGGQVMAYFANDTLVRFAGFMDDLLIRVPNDKLRPVI